MDLLHRKVLGACRQFMVPIARFLLRVGVGYKEFAEICKAAFVEVASDDYGIRGRKTNMSRVAAMTGLTRKEIKKIRAAIESAQEQERKTRRSPASEVLHFWHTDRDFMDADDNPALLTFDGPHPSFVSLVKRYGGDIPPGAMLTELTRAGAVCTTGDGHLVAKKRYFVLAELDEEFVESMAFSLTNIVSTLVFNATRGPKEDARPERYAFSTRFARREIPIFRSMAEDEITEFLDRINTWIARHEQKFGEPEQGLTKTAGIGVYYFEE